MASEYDYNPFKYKWYKSKNIVDCKSSFDLDKNIKPTNYLSSIKTDFVIFVRESFSNNDINLIIKALLKVEQEFKK